jgi:hypothetical protein
MATILKVDVDDPYPLRLDTWDALDRMHEIHHVTIFINGELQKCIENEWNKIGTYQLEAGHVKNYHKRKSLEAQQLERIQQGFDDTLLKAAVENNVLQALGGRKDSQITMMPDNISLHEENAEDSKQSATKKQQSVQDLTIVEGDNSAGNDVAEFDENGKTQGNTEDDEAECS